MHIKWVKFWCQLQTQRGLKITLLQGKTHPIRWSAGPTTTPARMPISHMDEHGESLLWEECFDLFLCLRSYLKQPPFLANPTRQHDCWDFRPEFEQFRFEKIPFHLFLDSRSFLAANRCPSLKKMQQFWRGLNLAGWRLATAWLITCGSLIRAVQGEEKSLVELSRETQSAQTQSKRLASIISIALWGSIEAIHLSKTNEVVQIQINTIF